MRQVSNDWVSEGEEGRKGRKKLVLRQREERKEG